MAALAVLALAASLMLALASAGATLQFRLGPWLAEIFPAERVRLEPGRANVGPLQIEGRPITDATIASLRELPRVTAVYPIEAVRFPVRIEGQLFGEVLYSDVVIHGVPRELVEDAIAPTTRWAIPQGAEPWPVVASSYFLDLYNMGLARAAGLPLISPSNIIGRKFRVYFGESSIGLGRTAERVRFIDASVAGLTSQPALLGLAMPADVVSNLNRIYAPNQPTIYVQVVAQLEPAADRDAFFAQARTLGLHPSRQELLGSQLKLAVRFAGWGLFGLALAVLALGLLNFYQFFTLSFHARRVDLVRLRALGMTPRAAALLAVAEVAVVAVAALALALALNYALTLALADRITPLLERLATLPAGLFDPSPLWLALAALAILAAALLPALPMLRTAARAPMGDVIRDL